MGPPSQLTPCDRPLLCTAVLRPRLTCDPIRDSHTAVIPGSARTRHRFGDKGGRGGDLLAARRDGCQAEGWAARRDCVPCAPPLGLAGEDPRREEITTTSHRTTKPTGKISAQAVGGDTSHNRVGTPDPESGVWQQADRRSQPGPKSPPIYISWYINDYGRPWTSSDVNPRITPVHGRIPGTGGVLPVTKDQMVRSHVP